MIGHTPEEIIEREELLDEIGAFDEATKELIREMVLERNRADVLAEEILGLTIQPFHRALQKFALRNNRTLQLAFRGSGKTTTVTVVLTIMMILQNPNVRILLASRTHGFAKDILKEIRWHLENNELLIEIFGEQVGPKWGTTELIVKGRTKAMKESTITTVGVEGQVVGKHYDVIFGDDLVDESNARTPEMRRQVRTFYYKTLMPTLEPDGEVHIIGTRYHFDDLYGHLEEHDMDGTTQIVRALDERERSPWPDKFPAKHFKELRKNAGSIIFDSQYQCDTELMQGGIFQYDWMVECELSEVPDEAEIFHGVDVAIGKKEVNDYFAIVSIAVQGRKIWILDAHQERLTFRQQMKLIAKWCDRDDPVSVGIESNAYQAALAEEIKEKYPRIPAKKVQTKKDKDTRAIKVSARFEADEVRILKGNTKLIDHLVLYPTGSHDDLFDALDIAISRAYAARKRRRRGRRKKLGVIG